MDSDPIQPTQSKFTSNGVFMRKPLGIMTLMKTEMLWDLLRLLKNVAFWSFWGQEWYSITVTSFPVQRQDYLLLTCKKSSSKLLDLDLSLMLKGTWVASHFGFWKRTRLWNFDQVISVSCSMLKSGLKPFTPSYLHLLLEMVGQLLWCRYVKYCKMDKLL